MNKRISIITGGLLIISGMIFNSCQKAETPPVAPVVAPAPVAKARNNSPVGFTDTLKLFADTIPGAKYFWTGPNNFKSNLQNPYIVLTVPTGKLYDGEYTVTTTVGSTTTQAYHTYVTDMELTASCDSIGITNPTLPSTLNTFTTGTTANLLAANVLDIKNQIISVYYIWTGPNGFKSSLQNATVPVTMAAAGIYIVHDSIPATTSPYNQAHVGQPVTVIIIPRLSAPATLTANTPIVGGILNLTCMPPVGAAPSGNIYNWTGPNNFSAAGQNVSISNVTRAAVGTYSVSVTYSPTGTVSIPATVYANVNFSNSGCGGSNHVYYNGVLYNLVQIGNQCWFQENLQSGTNSPLFTWAAATPAGSAPQQGACPLGYHLPSDSMFQSLAANSKVNYNGYTLESSGAAGTPNRSGTNTTGFSAVNAIYLTTDTASIFWSATNGGSLTTARIMKVVSDSSAITFGYSLQTNAYNVRCMKD